MAQLPPITLPSNFSADGDQWYITSAGAMPERLGRPAGVTAPKSLLVPVGDGPRARQLPSSMNDHSHETTDACTKSPLAAAMMA
jgi:hypothetical protein